ALDRLRVDGRAIGGMEIVHHDLRIELEESTEVTDRLDVCSEGRLAREVAEMLAEKRLAAADERKGALELAATGQDRTARGDRKSNGQRHIAARAPDDLSGPSDHAHHRIVAGGQDLPVVREEVKGNPAKAPTRVVVAIHDWLVARVGARHHQ